MRLGRTASVLGVAVLVTGVLVACGDDDDSDAGATTDTTATAPAMTETSRDDGPLAGVPAPSGGSSTGTQSIPEGGELASYDTLATAAEVVDAYETELEDSGWEIVGGDAGGQGAGGTGLQATMGDRYLSIDAGETAVGSTFVSVCGWPQEPTTPECTFIDQGSSTTGGQRVAKCPVSTHRRLVSKSRAVPACRESQGAHHLGCAPCSGVRSEPA